MEYEIQTNVTGLIEAQFKISQKHDKNYKRKKELLLTFC